MTQPAPTLRDGMIHAAVEQRRVDETKIMQKVNAVNRTAFLQRFPGQLEHMMRLVSERLQFCLHKNDHVSLDNPDTWAATPAELASLSAALRDLDSIHQRWNPTNSDTVND